MSTRVTVTMNAALKRNLNVSYMVAEPLRKYLKEITEIIRDEAREEAPEDLGKMKKSHTAVIDDAKLPKWGRMEVRAVSNKGAPYPLFVHEGTRPHFPPVSAITPWANRHGIPPWALARSIAEKGTKANPWLERTVKKLAPKLKDLASLKAEILKRWNTP